MPTPSSQKKPSGHPEIPPNPFSEVELPPSPAQMEDFDIDKELQGARSRLLARNVPLPGLELLAPEVPLTEEEAEHLPSAPSGSIVTEADPDEYVAQSRALEKAAQRRQEESKKKWIGRAEIVSVFILAFGAVAIPTLMGMIPHASVLSVARFLHPPAFFVKLLRSTGILRWESAYFWPVIVAFVVTIPYKIITSAGGPAQITCRLGGMVWDRNSFCRGWLITGGTGCGKTACAIMHLFHELFINERGRRKTPCPPGLIPADKPRTEKQFRKMEASLKLYKKKVAAYEKRRLSALNQGAEFKETPPQKPDVRYEDPETVEYVEYPWGGICIDEKGLFWQRLQKLGAYYNRKHSLMLMQTKPDFAVDARWKPPVRFNVLSGDHIPSNTYASAIVKTAQQVEGEGSGGGGSAFFVSSAQLNIGWAIELCRGIALQEQLILHMSINDSYRPTLKRIFDLLSSREFYTDELMKHKVFANKGLKEDAKGNESPEIVSGVLFAGSNAPMEQWSPGLKKLDAALKHFKQRYWALPKETLGGVQGTITTYLSYFTADEIADVFCQDNTFEFEDIDKGMILCVAMPQKYQKERQYICTLLKLLFYTHVLRRFDRDEVSFKNKNLLVCWQDEAQRFITATDGNVDVIREAGATTVIASQSKTSLMPPLGGKEKGNVVILNLRNRCIFRAADEECAEGSATFLGKAMKAKKSISTGKSGKSVSTSYDEQYVVKPFELRGVKDWYAYVCHPSGKYKKLLIEPRDEEDNLPPWYPRPLKLKIWGFFHKLTTGRDHE